MTEYFSNANFIIAKFKSLLLGCWKKSDEQNSDLKDILLCAHALSGCDSTSAFFGRGKIKIIKLLRQRADLRKLLKIFNDKNATKEDLKNAGEKLILALYQAPVKEKSLNKFRYNLFPFLIFIVGDLSSIT